MRIVQTYSIMAPSDCALPDAAILLAGYGQPTNCRRAALLTRAAGSWAQPIGYAMILGTELGALQHVSAKAVPLGIVSPIEVG